MATNLSLCERLFRQECRSLAQYVSETWPWTHRADREAQDLVQSIIADERRWAEQLAGMILERGGQPIMGSYPDAFIHSNLHYVALDYLIERLAEYLETTVNGLRADLGSAGNDATLRHLTEQMIERKSGQLEALRRPTASAVYAKAHS
jgi:hypothetical protein